MIEVQTIYEKLNKQEQKKLASLILGYGKLKACSDFSGLHKNTIKRAKDGLTVSVDNAKIIREKLLSNS